jgi:hypothetical protein
MPLLRLATVLLLCASVCVAQHGAVLSAHGRVLVNDQESRAAALITGDRVLTGDEAFASITEPGSQVVLAQQTSGTMEGRRLLLNQGSASVTTTKAYAVQAGPWTVTPQAPSAHYEVSRVSCRILITAHAVPLKLSDGTIVQPGQSVTRTEANCLGGNAQFAPPHTGLVVGGSAISGTALGTYLYSREPQASPSRPQR